MDTPAAERVSPVPSSTEVASQENFCGDFGFTCRFFRLALNK